MYQYINCSVNEYTLNLCIRTHARMNAHLIDGHIHRLGKSESEPSKASSGETVQGIKLYPLSILVLNDVNSNISNN